MLLELGDDTATPVNQSVDGRIRKQLRYLVENPLTTAHSSQPVVYQSNSHA